MRFVEERLGLAIKNYMEDELRDTVKESLREKIDLMDKFLCLAKEDERYSGLNQAVIDGLEAWEGRQESPTNISRRLTITEQYLKSLIFIVNKEVHDEIMDNPLKREDFKEIIKYIDLTKLRKGGYLDLVVKEWEKEKGLTLERKYAEDDNQYNWAVAYTQRNYESHNIKSYTTKEAIQNIYSVLYVLLESTWKYKNKIENVYSDYLIYGDKDKQELLDRIRKEFDEKKLEETFVIMDISENTSDNSLPSLSLMDGKNMYMKLEGVAGLGKTRLMKHLQHKDALAGKKLAIYAELKELSSLKKTLFDLIVESSGLKKESCQLLMEKGDINLYLDGLNEILCPDDEKSKICDEIDRLSVNYPNIKILVSDRKDSSITVNKIPTYGLVPLNEGLIDEFIGKNTSSKQMEEKIKEVLNQDKSLYKIVKTPFMLLALIDIVENGEYTTNISNEEKLKAKFVKSLIKRETTEKREARADKIILLLAHLFIKDNDVDEDRETFKKRQILRKFKECGDYYGFTIDTVEVLELIVQMGILTKVDDDEFRFSNEIYQDYFVYEAFETVYDM